MTERALAVAKELASAYPVRAAARMLRLAPTRCTWPLRRAGCDSYGSTASCTFPLPKWNASSSPTPRPTV